MLLLANPKDLVALLLPIKLGQNLKSKYPKPTILMEKAYLPKNVEDRLYERWLSDESFKGKVSSQQEAFSIVIPPPNVTGVLTMGHVLNNTVQDILARRARQQGKSVLWLPGTDHAGIATQTKVENALKEDGRSKDSLGREEFVLQACLWRDKHGGIILNQLKKLGCSVTGKEMLYS